MKSYRILLPSELIPAAQRMFSRIDAESTMVDPEPIWRKQSRRLVQIDLTEFLSRLFERISERAGIATEELLRAWIEGYEKEMEGNENHPTEPPPSSRVSGKLRLIAEWAALGYTGKEEAIQELIGRLERG
jgi:hypothetical protein